jgi:hypothetical protein
MVAQMQMSEIMWPLYAWLSVFALLGLWCATEPEVTNAA